MAQMIRKWVPLWAIPVLVAMAVGTVWLRLAIVKTTYAINAAERTIRDRQQDYERAKLKAAGLRSPRRLEALARTKFDLRQPRADQVVHLK